MEVFIMAASSITKNFVNSGKEQVEMFVNTIEESAKNRPVLSGESRGFRNCMFRAIG